MRQPDEDEGTGLDRQREATARLVRERGWELAAEHRDADLSAWSGVTRPEFEKLRRQVEDREVDAVVVWKLDRAFRSLSEAVTFLTLCRESGVAFISASEGIDTSSPFGPVLFALFAAMAEIESTTKSDRITAWHLERAQDGKPSGGGTRPYGFKADRIHHDPAEKRELRKTATAILEGSSSIKREAKRLGMTTTGLRRVLTAPRTAGLRQHGEDGVTYPAVWKPLLEEQVWLELRARFSNVGARGPSPRYLLSGGVAVCGLCGANLTARPRQNHQRSYVCARESGGCGKIRALAASLEGYVAEQVNGHETHLAADGLLPRRPTDHAAGLTAELDADQGALEELARDRYVVRAITDGEFRAARDGLVERISETQRKLERLEHGNRREFMLHLEDVGSAPWELAPGEAPDLVALEDWRSYITTYVERVVVNPAVRGQNFFAPERIEIVFRSFEAA